MHGAVVLVATTLVAGSQVLALAPAGGYLGIVAPGTTESSMLRITSNPLRCNGSPEPYPNPGRLWSGWRRGGEIGVQPWQGSRFSILPPSLSPTLRAHR